MIALALAAQLVIGGVTLAPHDWLDGRVIADGSGKPVVMLTPTAPVLARIRTHPAPATLDGHVVGVRMTDSAIELDGAADFAAATALALRLSGRPPLPDSLSD